MRSKLARRRIVAVVALTAGLGCDRGIDPAPLGPDETARLRSWLDVHGLPPVDYVIAKFARHDVVILGEPHRFRDHPRLVQELIPRLPAHGVRVLATEFARAADQPLIDRLVDAPEWDEALARRIQMRQYSLWPWQEYLDIFRSAWRYNRSIEGAGSRFRIVGLNCDPDWSAIRTVEDLEDPAKRSAAWKGCSEADWASTLLQEIGPGGKALAFCGMHHAFARYRQPKVDAEGRFRGWGDVRFGNHLREALGGRVVSIALHQPWYERTSRYRRWTLRPVGGAIDQVMETRVGGPRPVGFDVAGTPFGELTDPSTIYAVGYERFTLSEYCDGYVYFRSFATTELVTFIEGFYGEDNLHDARLGVADPSFREASPGDFERRTKGKVRRDRARLRRL